MLYFFVIYVRSTYMRTHTHLYTYIYLCVHTHTCLLSSRSIYTDNLLILHSLLISQAHSPITYSSSESFKNIFTGSNQSEDEANKMEGGSREGDQQFMRIKVGSISNS